MATPFANETPVPGDCIVPVNQLREGDILLPDGDMVDRPVTFDPAYPWECVVHTDRPETWTAGREVLVRVVTPRRLRDRD